MKRTVFGAMRLVVASIALTWGVGHAAESTKTQRAVTQSQARQTRYEKTKEARARLEAFLANPPESAPAWAKRAGANPSRRAAAATARRAP